MIQTMRDVTFQITFLLSFCLSIMRPLSPCQHFSFWPDAISFVVRITNMTANHTHCIMIT